MSSFSKGLRLAKILGYKRTKYLPSSNQDERTDELTRLLIMARSLMSRNARNGENGKLGKLLREVRRLDIYTKNCLDRIRCEIKRQT